MNNFFEHVKAFFLKLFTVIFAFFNSILSVKNSPKEKKKIEEIKKEEGIKKEDVIVGTTPTSMPDEPSTLTSPHNETYGDEEKQKSGGAFVVDTKSHESTSHYLHDIGESGYCSSIHLLYLQLPHPIHQRSHDYHSNCGYHGYGDVALVENA